MLAAHRIVAFLVLGVTALAGAAALLAARRGVEPGPWVRHLLALAQTVLVAQVGLGLLLLSGQHRARDDLHYLYGALALAVVLAPWLYAPALPRRRLVWFGAATLVAAALAVRAYLTAS